MEIGRGKRRQEHPLLLVGFAYCGSKRRSNSVGRVLDCSTGNDSRPSFISSSPRSDYQFICYRRCNWISPKGNPSSDSLRANEKSLTFPCDDAVCEKGDPCNIFDECSFSGLSRISLIGQYTHPTNQDLCSCQSSLAFPSLLFPREFGVLGKCPHCHMGINT